MTEPKRVTIEAPAKLNLGLEVIGRRPDGFHQIVTILQAVTLFDSIIVEATPHASEITLEVDDPDLAGDDNLVVRAARSLQAEVGGSTGATIELHKRIPPASGMGGASSDAAATLLATAQVWEMELDRQVLRSLAARLGSDVPFFLDGGTSLAEGRGEVLTPLPGLEGCWCVLVTPSLAVPIPRKTATLYAALAESDRSSGEAVRRQAARLRRGDPLDPGLLRNAFRRPLLALRPELRGVEREMRQAGAPFVALSGAGPTHYTIVEQEGQGLRLAEALRRAFGSGADVRVCAPAPGPPAPMPM